MTPAAPRKPEWSPPLWLGCDLATWVGLLAHNGFAVHRSRWSTAAVVSAVSVLHTALSLAQQAFYRRRVARTPIPHAPVFILGHWRTGTTLLHELLTRDPRHASPTTYDCFAPHHFLLTRSWLLRLLGRLMPSRRPMDNMAAGWDRPQEDEFALCLLGQPSPYRRIAFPNRPAGLGALDLRGLSPATVRRWQTAFYRLLQALTLANGGRRLILKSPPHTCRIPVLRGLFPDARFVHLVRDPYAVYPSTLHLWRSLYALHALQRPSWKGLQEDILEAFVRMDDRLQEGKRLLPPGRFHELRYEDLVRDPLGRLEALYRALDLGDFEPARPHVEAHVAGLKNYETNRYVLTPAERRSITSRWGGIIRRYGYAVRND
jgi:omega-hydroxy-beta-dihydromenaquinone-9 sulfotransferase